MMNSRYMNTRHIFLTVAMGLPLLCAAQTTQKFTASKANEYGLVYSLPLTEIDITVEAEHTERTPGEFYNYARRHLGISDAITEASNTVTVKSVTIAIHGVANPENQWMVQFKSGTPVSMLLNDQGQPLAINSDVTASTETPVLPVANPRQPTVLETEAARQAMTQDMIRSSSISKRAELAAQRIFELRDMRSDLLSGQSDNPPADGQAMKLVLDNLAGQEEALTAMFAGTTSVWTDVETITVRPDSTDISSEVIARISPYEGIIDADNLAGAPLTMAMRILERGQLPVNDKGEAKKFPKGGVAYTIPGTARVTVSYGGNIVGEADVPLAQLGVTFGLDPSLFSNKKSPSMAQFDPATGAVVLIAPAE